jgi:hypothetical protein
MHRQNLVTCLFVCFALLNIAFINTFASADDSPIDPNATIADQELQGVVTGVRGMVQIRQSETEPWVKAEDGMKLAEGAEFRTGPRSAVQFKFPPDQTITLDRLGTIKVLTAVAEHNKIKTDLGMTYGRTRYDIRKAGFEHESTIRSPSATLSVRGTRVGIQDGAMGFYAWSSQSRAYLYDQTRRKNFTFGANANMDENANGAADNAKRGSTVNPGDGNANDGDETDLILNRPGFLNPGGGGSGGNLAHLKPQNETPDLNQLFTGYASGSLIFTLSWELPQESDAFSDLDFAIKSPDPGDPTIGTFDLPYSTPSGGVAGSDTFTNTHYESGSETPFIGSTQEVIAWESGTFPTGTYKVGVIGFEVVVYDGSTPIPSSQNYTVKVEGIKPGVDMPTELLTQYSGTVHNHQTQVTDVTIGVNALSEMRPPSVTE